MRAGLILTKVNAWLLLLLLLLQTSPEQLHMHAMMLQQRLRLTRLPGTFISNAACLSRHTALLVMCPALAERHMLKPLCSTWLYTCAAATVPYNYTAC
jgi:hypothetical protein